MANEAKIGVVTVTYNSAQVLDGFLSSLLRQSHTDFLLYVVDNASSDDTLERLARYDDHRIVLIANRENVGVARGNNQGIRAALEAGCDSVLLINNDTEFGTHLVSSLGNGLRDHKCDMIVPKIMYFDDSAKIWCAGGFFHRMKGYLGVHCGQDENDEGQFDEIRSIEYSPTCCMLIRREVFDRLGLMDENYFIYCDDADFCLRAKRASLSMIYLPAATVWHKVSSLTGGGHSEFAIRQLTGNHIYYICKNFGFWRKVYYLPAYQLRLLYKLLFRIVDCHGFMIRENAFFAGWKLFRKQKLCTNIDCSESAPRAQETNRV
jgi:GT2 family glycosyltransferase